MRPATRVPGQWTRGRSWALAVSTLALVALLYAWPLALHLTTAFPGTATDLDVATLVWNVGWTAHALDHGRNLLHTDAVLAPFGADLRWHAYGLLQNLLVYPLVHWLGVVGAFNTIVIGTVWLNGLAVYALVYRLVRQAGAALVAGAWFMLGGPLLQQVSVGRPTFASLWITAIAVLLLMALLDRPRPWHGLGLGLALLAALLTDFQILLFTTLWLALYGLGWLARGGLARLDSPRLASLTVAAVVVGAPFLLIYYPALVSAGDGGYPRPSLRDMLPYSFRVWDYVTPATIPIAYGWEFLLGTLVAVVTCRSWRDYRLWLAGAIAFLILALGPFLQPTPIPLPLALLRLWPPLSQFRTPYRLAMPALLGLTVVTGFALAQWLPRWRAAVSWTVVALAIAARLVAVNLFNPLVTQSYPSYAVYTQLAREAGDFVVLEVPFGVRSGLERIGNGGEALQYYQHIHGKRLLNGMIARLPRTVFDAYRAHPSLLLLSGAVVSEGEAQVRGDLAAVLMWTGARYVLVHRAWLDPDQDRRIETVLDGTPGLARVGTEADLVIYRWVP